MFKNKVIISIMLAGVVCGNVLMCAIECAQGSKACVGWYYTALMSIVVFGATVIWMVIGEK